MLRRAFCKICVPAVLFVLTFVFSVLVRARCSLFVTGVFVRATWLPKTDFLNFADFQTSAASLPTYVFGWLSLFSKGRKRGKRERRKGGCEENGEKGDKGDKGDKERESG